MADESSTYFKVYKKKLKSIGCEVHFCGNGREALKLLTNNCYSLIVSEVQMPEMDGKELLTEIKRNYRKMKIVLMAGQSFTVQKFRLLGALDLLEQPVDTDILIKTVQNIAKEKRTSFRFPYQFSAIINQEIKAHSVNISCDGILLECDKMYEVGTEIDLELFVPETPYKCHNKATVQRLKILADSLFVAIYLSQPIGEFLVKTKKSILRRKNLITP